MSRFIVDWAVRTADDVVLEPSAGEAAFLLAAGQRLRVLRDGAPLGLLGAHARPRVQLHGVELHAASAAAAHTLLADQGIVADLIVGDFFDVAPAPQYDVVVGNPPYVRYQEFAGEARARGLRAAFAQGVRLTGLASAWAPFTVHAAQFLKPGGRLGLVLPAELLTVKYAAEVRRYLLGRFATVRLVLFENLVFPGVLEEVVLLLAEGEGPSSCFEVYQARDLADLVRRGGEAGGIPWARFTPEPGDAGGKWIPALLDPRAMDAYRALCANREFASLGAWGETYLGSVTGNNRYFTLTAAAAVEHQLAPEELVRISPPGSRHLRGLTFTDAAWGALSREGAATYLFAPNTERPSAAARRYVAAGAAAGVHKAYKCRKRNPWWRVPLVATPDLFLTYMAHDRPRLVTNAAGVHVLNSLYGVTLRPEHRSLGRTLLPLASLNSVTLLGSELVGRAYGGGLLKLEPREADHLPLPAPGVLAACATELEAVRAQVGRALRGGKLDEAVEIVDRVLLIKQLGCSFDVIQSLRTARAALFARRVARGKGTAPADLVSTDAAADVVAIVR